MPVCLGAYSHFEPIMKDKTHLRYLAQANALIDIPEDVDAVSEGTSVQVIEV